MQGMTSFIFQLACYSTLMPDLQSYFVILGNQWVRKTPLEDQSDIVLVDWEMCCVHVPQRDPANFLLFTLPLVKTPADMLNMFTEYAEFYRNELVKNLLTNQHPSASIFTDKQRFHRIFKYMVFECVVNRGFNCICFPPAVQLGPITEFTEKLFLYLEAVA